MHYDDIIYYKPNNKSFKNKIDSIQYKTCAAITGAIQGTCKECLCQKNGIRIST